MSKIAYYALLETNYDSTIAAVLPFPQVEKSDGPVETVGEGYSVRIWKDGPVTIEVGLRADAPITVDLLKNGEALRHLAADQTVVRETIVDVLAKKGDAYSVLVNGVAIVDASNLSTSFSLVG